MHTIGDAPNRSQRPQRRLKVWHVRVRGTLYAVWATSYDRALDVAMDSHAALRED